MTITLKIDNCDALPDGGPLAYSSNKAGFDFGRESHLDWTLPDESRYISGRHCEIRFERGQYCLYDISRNGTFLNGSQDRVKSPHELQNGDKIAVGHYIIVVSVDGVEAAPPVEDFHGTREQNYASASEDIWSVGGDVPDPISRRDLMPPKEHGHREADFSQQFLDIPQMVTDENYLAAANSADPFATPTPAAPPAPHQAPVAPPQAPAAALPIPNQPGAIPTPAGFAPVPQPGAPYVDPHQIAQNAGNQPQPGSGPIIPGAPQSPFPASVASEPFASSIPPLSPPPAAPVAAMAPPVPQAKPAMPASAPVASAAPGGVNIIEQIAAGAGVSVDAFGTSDPAEIAFEIGAVLRVSIEQMAQLLKARAAAKTMAKSSNRTMISALDNNPLKFVPTTDEMFDVMFARRKAGYMGARQSFENGFEDLKIHEFSTYAAMQKALSRLLESFSPDAIEENVPSSTFSSKSSKAWEAYVAQWEAMSEPPNENGALDIFLKHFATAYDEASKSRKGG